MNQLRRVGLFMLAMLAQWWWSTHWSIAGLAPQLLLVLTVALGASFGPSWAMCCGFLWGLFLDTLSPRLFGANALALTWVGYGTGSVRRQLDVAGVPPQCLVVFGMTWAYFLVLGMLGMVFAKKYDWVGWPVFLLDPVYNCVVAAAFLLWNQQWKHR